MREIIFRGKRFDNGEWATGFLLPFPDGVALMYERDLDDKEVVGTTSVDVDQKTVGEYTGLNDRECHPIYEGDILHVTSLKPESFGKEMNVVVEYDGGRAAFLVRNGEKFQQLGLCELENDCVVVGNIYDNPELLTKNPSDL